MILVNTDTDSVHKRYDSAFFTVGHYDFDMLVVWCDNTFDVYKRYVDASMDVKPDSICHALSYLT